MKENQYIQYGCGLSAPKEWRNFDASPTLRFERIPVVGKMYTRNEARFPDTIEYGDIVKGLPIANGYCKGVYCSHVLEHLALQDFRVALKNTFKVLSSGGIFRLVVPDLEYSIKKYVNDNSSEAAFDFLRETSLGKEKRAKGVKGFFLEWVGNSQHLWMWDYNSIEKELAKVGFVNIRRASFGDATDEMFKYVEKSNRWNNCLGVECSKP